MTTNLELKNAKPKDKDYTIKVDTGLTVLVKSSGAKLWRFRYSFLGKRCLISLGKYPQISLKEAKTKQREYLDLLDKGVNPSTHKQTQKIKLASELAFKSVAYEWHKRHYKDKNQRHAKLVLQRLEKYIFPTVGRIPIGEIEAPMMFNLVESIQDKDFIETGKRVNSICSMVFRYGVARGFCSRDVTQDYRGMLKSQKSKHMPTLTEESEIGELLADIHAYQGTQIVRTAMIISAYIFVRPNELAQSEWAFIDFEKSHWVIPARLMKMKRDHLIPFPSQVGELLKALHPITGHSKYIFPSAKSDDKPMNSETVNKTIRKLKDGYYIGRMVSHGFRGMASTILNEHKRHVDATFGKDEIELQLAHVEENKVRDAYNHAEYLDSRTEMVQWYADHLDELREKNNHKLDSF